MSIDEAAEDEVIATLSDYLDGALPPARRTEVETELATNPDWRRIHGELVETREAMSGLMKARAPDSFTQDVTSTINKRSAGRFFGRRTLGDRVPFGVLLIVALIALGVIAALLHSSATGTIRP